MKSTTEHQKWLDEFILELRVRDVPGELIGDAVSTVEAHLRDTGEQPADAFGSPGDYAENLDLPGRRAPRGQTWILSEVALAAFTVLAFAVVALFTGSEFEVTGLLLALILANAVTGAVVIMNLDAIARSWSLWQGGLLGMAIAVTYALVIGLTPDPVLLTLPTIPVVVVTGLVSAGFIWHAVRGADPVTKPVAL
ncbi:hypothetical protein [Arthrobacter flavus]|uniref:DUF1700 domain-containing protein n=1 Tax=Arthrobacter flavus TaxID=95172 RepID=A0ABW4Q5Z3_9MICC